MEMDGITTVETSGDSSPAFDAFMSRVLCRLDNAVAVASHFTESAAVHSVDW